MEWAARTIPRPTSTEIQSLHKDYIQNEKRSIWSIEKLSIVCSGKRQHGLSYFYFNVLCFTCSFILPEIYT